ncbi:MAG: hypothetical protein A2527_13750 [Candidatus Lambdaproteobacteria bacterium RIFOXYD2_FULL_50_16]|uniref:Calcineurin-like phosphoesterase domain-containing protein n=1 Tax=Candidatus Lambdaproteobacteria bacterium RIFOXYD2_FULL_50_16 TaxID=1817772 RepID=A0A1F6G5B4_9PROT|nr:MAG: hypothetical protein A2527_13750 [Candidatus Lambdaproteobacteria bacterium RIFOXYD2_FULL_50_16]
MKLFAISDTHFWHKPERNMNQFGEIWIDHESKIKRNWREAVGTDDLVMMGGDISWASRTEEAMVHLRQLCSLPGIAKVMVKGNHDHWWKKTDKLQPLLPQNLTALSGSAVKIKGEVICGTRGWLSPNDPCSDTLDKKTFEKEMGLLEQALIQAVTLGPSLLGIHLLLHFPPFTTTGANTPFWEVIKRYPVATCTYGHFHMRHEWEKIPKGEVDGVWCSLTSSDFINHRPLLISPR